MGESMSPEKADRMWGEGNWVHHPGCGTHHVDFHKSKREIEEAAAASGPKEDDRG